MNSESSNSARINVHVPAHARVYFDGAPTWAPGPFRQFVSPPLSGNRTYAYEIRAAWTENGGTTERTRKVEVHPGQPVNVDFLAKSGTEREIRSSDEFSPPPRPGQPPKAESPDENKSSTPPLRQPPKPENPDESKPPHRS
jgi:uncharacterized protein (TIGR03000 family)